MIPSVGIVEVLVVDDGSRDRTSDVASCRWRRPCRTQSSQPRPCLYLPALPERGHGRGADVIVNTDADNHYDQTRIPELIAPILAGKADIVVGSRVFETLKMKFANKHGNRAANWMMQRLLKIPGVDVSSGYRAYSREAALSLNILSNHTNTDETLFNALDRKLRVISVPLDARHVERPSRLISSLPKHVWRAGLVIAQSILRYRPLQAYGTAGVVLVALGAVPFLRFLYFLSRAMATATSSR